MPLLRIYLILAILLLTPFAHVWALIVDDWVMMQPGNTWTYENEADSTDTVEEIIGSTSISISDIDTYSFYTSDYPDTIQYMNLQGGLQIYKLSTIENMDGYGDVEFEFDFDPVIQFAAEEMSVGDSLSNSGKVNVEMVVQSQNISMTLTTKMDYTANTEITYLEDLNTQLGGFSTVRVESNITISGEVLGSFFSKTMESTGWYVEGLGKVKSWNNNDNKTWVISGTSIPESSYINGVKSITSIAAPTQLSLSVDSSDQITLNWVDNADNEQGYEVERKISGGDYEVIAPEIADTTSFIDSELSAETAYVYRVRAYNANGESSYSEEEGSTTSSAMSWRLVASCGNDIISFLNGNTSTEVEQIQDQDGDSYSVERGYGALSSLGKGRGYWVKALPTTIFDPGVLIADEAVNLLSFGSGWGLIGVCEDGATISELLGVNTSEEIEQVQDEGGKAYSVSRRYGTLSSVDAGKGYWVKALTDTVIIISANE